MSMSQESTFTKYTFSEQELPLSQVLTTLQRQNILTQIATIAEMRLAIIPDPLNYTIFIQQEAHYKGQMDALKYLIDCSDEAQERALNVAREQAAKQEHY